MTKYAVVIYCKEHYHGNDLVTKKDERVIVTNGEWGDTSSDFDPNDIDKDVKIFATKESAEKFAKKWKGHPSYYNPSGQFEIIELEPVTVQKIIGYKKK